MRALRVLGLGLLVLAGAAPAEERILSFHGDIRIDADASMAVTETITVVAEGREIKRGIFRDFPTRYRDRFGRHVTVAFDVLAVTRDGAPEPWFTRPLDNGVRVYIGNRDVHIPRGEHRYTVLYRTARQLGFFAAHDELYWNVTGTGWAFPVDRASASVRLPPGVPAGGIRADGWTGPQGATGKDYEARVDAEGLVSFETTRPLRPREGLTIAVGWPKGHVREPGLRTRLGWFVDDNPMLAIGGAGLGFVLIYYLLAWTSIGRGPPAGVVIPLYAPPRGFSPASVRYVRRMGYDHKTFAAALVSLAVKGWVTLSRHGDDWTVAKLDGPGEPLAPGEATLRRRLFAQRVLQPLTQSHHALIGEALEAHENALEKDYERRYFTTNFGFVLGGAALSAATLASAVWATVRTPTAVGIAIAVMVIATVVISRAIASIRARTGSSRLLAVVVGGLFGIVFISVWAFMFLQATLEGMDNALLAIALMLALGLLNGVFYELMKAPTRAGRALLDRIDGFREYLSVAERDELKMKNPPDKTPALFERFLPYAMALDVEEAWSDKFAGVLARAERTGGASHPAWYGGGGWHGGRGAASVASGLGAGLAASVAAASTAPGSSSGGSFGGGGGSSGGGGGGGGGGGW